MENKLAGLINCQNYTDNDLEFNSIQSLDA